MTRPIKPAMIAKIMKGGAYNDRLDGPAVHLHPPLTDRQKWFLALTFSATPLVMVAVFMLVTK